MTDPSRNILSCCLLKTKSQPFDLDCLERSWAPEDFVDVGQLTSVAVYFSHNVKQNNINEYRTCSSARSKPFSSCEKHLTCVCSKCYETGTTLVEALIGYVFNVNGDCSRSLHGFLIGFG